MAIEGGGNNCRVACWDVALRLATTTAVLFPPTAVALALNVAVVAPTATVTEAGTVRIVLPPATDVVNLRPPVGAIFDTVAVQDAVPGVVNGFGVQTSAVTLTTAGVNITVNGFETEAKVAVITAPV